MPATLYDLFGVAPTATTDEIHQAYRRLARQVHPDANPSAQAQQTFQQLNEAHALLSDPARRAAYDLSLKVRTLTVVNVFVSRPVQAAGQPASGGNHATPGKRTTFHAKDGKPRFKAKPARFHGKQPKWRFRKPAETFRQKYGGLLAIGGVVVAMSIGLWYLMRIWIAPAPVLDLGMRGISTWPAALNNQPVVQQLKLNDNDLQSLPPSIATLPNLLFLDVSRNQLQTLPNELYNLPRLYNFAASRNGLTRLEAGIGRLNTLHVLDVSHNRITYVSPRIQALHANLERLNVAGNPLPPALRDSLRRWLPNTRIQF
jgi:curved DNA-binding protein CbpA